MAAWVIFLNGKATQIPEGQTVRELVQSLGIAEKSILVEVNANVLPRHEWETFEPQHGDRLEILKVVAGG
jgi:sulfur carrier protein